MEKLKGSFLWVGALIGLVVSIFGAVGILNLVLRTYVFTLADKANCPYYPAASVPVAPDKATEIPGGPSPEGQARQCAETQKAQKQRDAALDTSLVIVGAPIFIGFYRQARKL